MTQIPRLYETEGIPLSEKIIHQHYSLPFREGFYWLIAELEPDKGIAFGYANLNDPDMAEWGYISIRELDGVGAILDKSWKPVPFKEALAQVEERYLR